MIDQATIDRIYAAADIVDVISDYVSLRKKGANYQACCPFHNEKTPSFIVSPAKGLFKCFGCGKGGNAVTFVMEHEGMNYVEALKTVAKKYNIEVREKELSAEEIRKNDDRESMMVLNSFAADYFKEALRSPEGKSVGLSYFHERGFTDATIEKFGLGYCPRGGAFTKAALAAGYKEEFLTSTGLAIKRDDGTLFDRFSERVMFPIHTISGRVLAFGGRTLRTDKVVAKYQNSPESEIYSKKMTLYGIFFAKKAISQLQCAILVEGYTDVISMHQAGVENVVASSGTSLTTEQVKLLKRFTDNITVIYDGDSAGIKAALRGIDMILREGMNVRVVLLPKDEDPDSFAKSHTAEQVQDYIRANEEDFITFKSKLLMRECGGDVIKRAAVITDMVQSIAEIPDAIPRSMYIKECARIMDIDEQVLMGEVARKRISVQGDSEAAEFIRKQSARQSVPAAVEYPSDLTAGSTAEELEKELTKYLLKYGQQNFRFKDGRNTVELNVARTIIDELQTLGGSFRNPTYRTIYETYCRLLEQCGPGEQIAPHHFTNNPDAEVCNVSADLLWDENYTPSKIWQRHDIAVESESELLSEAIPRAVLLYKSKIIDSLITELKDSIGKPETTDEQKAQTAKRIVALNRERIAISKKLSRIIV